jgi:hypothetical protein
MVATFEAFSGRDSLKDFRLPKSAGMREFNHARCLRNAIAHGAPLTRQRLVMEETALFRPGKTVASNCSLGIDSVLEPLWARLLIYARSLEQGAAPVPDDPGVVVSSEGRRLWVQTFDGLKKVGWAGHPPQSQLRVGEIVSLKDACELLTN